MGGRKSQIDVVFYVGLLRNILADAYDCHPEIPRYELARDMECLEARVKFEGFSFLAKTLPKLGKALDQALEIGSLEVPSEFARKSKSGKTQNIPTFMSALFRTVFDVSGALAPAKRQAIGEIRQVCFVAYKVEVPMSEAATIQAAAKFTETDSSLPDVNGRLVNNPIFSEAKRFLRELFRGFDPLDIKPRHGPGSVADRYKGRDKYLQRYFDPSIDCLYPYAVYVNGGVHSGTLRDCWAHRDLPWGVPPPARVVFVPKDSRGPRTISCEPALLQYLQQGLGSAMVDLFERSPLTKGYVNFTDQSINQHMARVGSQCRLFATLDMKDASDRVSWSLVKALFPEELVPYLSALRSASTALPDGSVCSMRKFAPMGSALCFPIEAITFYALAQAVVRVKTQTTAVKLTSIFVYGDDIVTRSEDVSAVQGFFELYGLKFNPGKCYVRGFFRESCGLDVYKGVDVTPVRLRCYMKQGHCCRVDAYRLSKNASGFFDKGYWRTADYLWKYVEGTLGRELPTMPSTFEGICRTSHRLPTRGHLRGWPTRWNDRYQRLEVRTYGLKRRSIASPFPTDVQRLLHNLIHGCARPYDDNVAVLAGTALPTTCWAVV